MKALEVFQDADFRKVLDAEIKKFIDSAMEAAGKDKPTAASLHPLKYNVKELDSAVKRMTAGAQIGLAVFDRYAAAKGLKNDN